MIVLVPDPVSGKTSLKLSTKNFKQLISRKAQKIHYVRSITPVIHKAWKWLGYTPGPPFWAMAYLNKGRKFWSEKFNFNSKPINIPSFYPKKAVR
jgi:hypothetical protein